MMRSFFVVSLLGTISSAEFAITSSMEFVSYIAMHNKNYDSVDEYNLRREQFARTHAFIQEHNNSTENVHRAAHNKFSDWTEEEF